MELNISLKSISLCTEIFFQQSDKVFSIFFQCFCRWRVFGAALKCKISCTFHPSLSSVHLFFHPSIHKYLTPLYKSCGSINNEYFFHLFSFNYALMKLINLTFINTHDCTEVMSVCLSVCLTHTEGDCVSRCPVFTTVVQRVS